MALTETRIGMMPGSGGTQTLARAVGERRAKELIFRAKVFGCDEALAWGLINQICDLNIGSRLEIEAYNRLVSSEDRHEGVRAFNEKRAPQFEGC